MASKTGNILKYLKEEYKDFISGYQRKSYDANAKNKMSVNVALMKNMMMYFLKILC